jgi:hypothetical protein
MDKAVGEAKPPGKPLTGPASPRCPACAPGRCPASVPAGRPNKEIALTRPAFLSRWLALSGLADNGTSTSGPDVFGSFSLC